MLKLTVLALALTAAPAFASSHHHAEPLAKPAAAKLLLRDMVWQCGDSGCAAGRSNSRPAVVCALLVKKVGGLKSFTTGGEAMAASELEKCNARAGR
jgi:hypothetical protein